MATVIRRVKHLLTRPSQVETVWECRRCGTTVDPDTEECPACGTGDIAHYRIA